jgi:hypothetical protein
VQTPIQRCPQWCVHDVRTTQHFSHSKFLCKWFFTNLRGGLKLSLSKGTSADVKRDQGLMFLRALKQSGMPEDLLNAVRLESSGYVTSGSMTDAAKRGCPDDSAACVFEFLRDPVESMEEPSSANAAQLSMPVMPKSMASPIRKSTALMDTELPEDS